MAEKIDRISVFIASPSGLEDERNSTKRIVDHINKSHSRNWGCQLELVGWEETLPGHGRPQSLINKELDRCEYFIGLIHDYWGSKPNIEASEFTSGFEEEFHRAKNLLTTGKMKDMAVYFKAISKDRLNDPGPSLTKVKEFREECFKKRDALYKEFTSLIEYEELIRTKLESIGWSESGHLTQNTEQNIHSESFQNTSETKNKNDENNLLLDSESSKFIKEFSKYTAEWNQAIPYDVARFRLIASCLEFNGNDEIYLGNHDSNLLFEKRNEIEWTQGELKKLLKTGLKGLTHQNVPLWFYIQRSLQKKNLQINLNSFAAFGEGEIKASSINLLNFLKFPIPSFSEHWKEEDTIRDWLNNERKNEEFEAAISYLSAHGLEVQIELLSEINNVAEADKKSRISHAIVAIKSRIGQSNALDYVNDENITDLSHELCEKLFSQSASLTTLQLSKYLNSASAEVRKATTGILADRSEITIEQAQTLISDSDYSLRFIAIQSMEKLGQVLDENTVKKALSPQKPRNTSVLGLGLKNEKNYYEQYKFDKLAELNYNELSASVKTDTIIVDEELIALYSCYPGRVKVEIRENLKDGYKAYFDKILKILANMHGENSPLLQSSKSLLPYIRMRIVNTALISLASLGEKVDLDLIRIVIDSHQISESEDVLRYFKKYGEWLDIERVMKLDKNKYDILSTVPLWNGEKSHSKAKVMLSIAKNRVADLLKVEMNSELKNTIIFNMSTRELSSLSDELLVDELNHENFSYRKVFALKCCISLSKKRITDLLDRYMNKDGSRFYNSIHILDMGASLKKSQSKSIAQKQLVEFE